MVIISIRTMKTGLIWHGLSRLRSTRPKKPFQPNRMRWTNRNLDRIMIGRVMIKFFFDRFSIGLRSFRSLIYSSRYSRVPSPVLHLETAAARFTIQWDLNLFARHLIFCWLHRYKKYLQQNCFVRHPDTLHLGSFKLMGYSGFKLRDWSYNFKKVT
jgi:hypothetical protein